MKNDNIITGRATKEDILKDYKNIVSNDYFQKILNSIQNIVSIINYQRQIIFTNKILIDNLKVLSIEEILGARIGEAIKCIHSLDEETGCGTSESCNYCGANQAITQSQKTNTSVIKECRITSNLQGYENSFDFNVTATPIEWQKEKYTIVSLSDTSSLKRQNFLEKIFFHDIMNKIGSLNCYFELIDAVHDSEKAQEFMNNAIELSKDITEDIKAQQELLSAESNQLTVNKVYISTKEIIDTVVKQLTHHEVAKNKIISIDKNTDNAIIFTDNSLIKRVLINLLKNALEAISPKETVTIGCKADDNTILFRVHNPTFITREHELQIFQRSFSTKGANRGLGTYSIKLLTEKYLGGKVSFKTDINNGTTFNILFKIQKSEV